MPTVEHYSFRVLIIDHYDSYTNNLLQLLNTNGTEETDDLRSWWPVIIRYDEYKWYRLHMLR
jgi:para-aminobenzoate synthetase